MRIRSRHWVGWALALAAACQQSDQIIVSFGTNGAGLNGFFCQDSQGMPLIERCAKPLLPDGGLRPINLVFDLISLDGGPSCATSDLVSWCAGGQCTPQIPYRQCVPLPMGPL